MVEVMPIKPKLPHSPNPGHDYRGTRLTKADLLAIIKCLLNRSIGTGTVYIKAAEFLHTDTNYELEFDLNQETQQFEFTVKPAAEWRKSV